MALAEGGTVGAVRLAEVCDVIEQQAQAGFLPLSQDLTDLLFTLARAVALGQLENWRRLAAAGP